MSEKETSRLEKTMSKLNLVSLGIAAVALATAAFNPALTQIGLGAAADYATGETIGKDLIRSAEKKWKKIRGK